MPRKLFICGASGWGKSTLARELTDKEFRRIILDPSGDWERKGVKPVRSLMGVSEVINSKWKTGFDIVYTPPTGKEAVALHQLSILVFGYQQERGWYRGRASDEIMIVCEEMAESYGNVHVQRSDLSGFRRAILQGRHYGISLCGISQRPQDVAALYRDMADEKYAFALHSDTGRDAVISTFGRSHKSAYERLPKFHFLALRDGAVTPGKTRKA